VIPRSDAIAHLSAEPFDVAVVGGGITGAGVALDAASRGYSVALVEKDDFASGTSSRSSKLVHGGLRYLQQFDIGLVREALLERQLMVTLAPHLVRPLKMVVPAFEGARPDRAVGVGLNMYDVLSLDKLRRRRRRREAEARDVELDGSAEWSPERHRTITGEEVSELLPALAAREPTSGYLFYDCQTDDARLVLTVLGEAERFGAICANGLEVVELAEEDGRAAGVVVEDGESGERFTVRAANVVNATGVWADRIRPEELHDVAEVPTIRPSRGTHVTVGADRLPIEAGAIVPAAGGRTIFALPWLGSALLGTTDNDYDGDIDHVRPPEEDVAYLLEATNAFFGNDLRADDVTGAYAGVRPLISRSDAKRSVDISRKAELYETQNGLITITGGKLTTWRRMAKMAVDRLVERDDREAPCRTHEIPLGLAIDPSELPDVEGVPDTSKAALAGRYGHAAHDVLAIARERGELAQPIVAGKPDLLAEAVFAGRREQARGVGDVMLRRTRLALLAAPALLEPGSRVPEQVAGALAPERGWDATRIAVEARRFRDEARDEGVLVAAPEVAAGAGAGAEAGAGAAARAAAAGAAARAD
jgi:glycerol-3-phosphate dehydrogenase